VFIEAKDGGSGGDSWKHSLEFFGKVVQSNLQSNHHHQQTNTKSCLYRLDALSIAQPTVSKH